MNADVLDDSARNSGDEISEDISKSFNGNINDCEENEAPASTSLDSNLNAIDSENVLESLNTTTSNTIENDVTSFNSDTNILLSDPSDISQPDSGNAVTHEVTDACESNSDIFENDSVFSNATNRTHSNSNQNCHENEASSYEIRDSGDAKDSPIEHGDICKQGIPNREIDCESEVNSTDVPNGITKTVMSADLKNISSTKCAAYNRKKLKKIWDALEKGDIDFLKEAAITRGGLLNDEIRKMVWPKLVGVNLVETSPRPCIDEIQAHPYYQQVVLDVNRSLKRFPPSIKEAQRLMMLDQLVFLIMRVLCRHPEFHYYQGYHDICVTFLLVLGEDTAYHVVEKLSRTHLNIFMEKTMEPTIHLLEYIYLLIGKQNPLLKNFLSKSEVGVAYCLSWLITWFGHVLNDYDNVVRLFDLFIVSHPWMPMYLTSVVVLHREMEIWKQECDMASVHSLLANIPDDLPFEDLILKALSLHKTFTPKMLSYERPYVKRSKGKVGTGWKLIQSVSKTLKSAVPASNYALPLVIAAAVLVTAVLYQVYKH